MSSLQYFIKSHVRDSDISYKSFIKLIKIQFIGVEISLYFEVPKDAQIFSQGSKTGIWETRT